MEIYIDGKFLPSDQAGVSVFDHGLLYGDGIFEGIRLYDGNIFRLEQHLERLEQSAVAIRLALPLDRAGLIEATRETCRRNGLRDGYIRIVATRGVGPMALTPWVCPKPTLIIIACTVQLYPPELYADGISAATVPTRRIGYAALPPTIKTINYLNQVLAKFEARDAGAMEGILLNDAGFVAECTAVNLFLVRRGELLTPASSHGALEGITRQTIFDLAREHGWPIREANLSRHDVWTADECFVTGTAAEIMPITQVDGRRIGSGKAGPLTRQVLELFRAKAVTEGVKL